MVKTVLDRIKALRGERGYSQEYMALELGMERNNYRKIEAGLVKLTVERLEKIATILGVDVSYFISSAATVESSKASEQSEVILRQQVRYLENLLSEKERIIAEKERLINVLETKIK